MTAEQDHERWRTALGPYVLDALPAHEARELEEHLLGCDSCRAELDEVQPAAAVLAELRALGPERPGDAEVPPTLGVRVLAAVERERESERHPVPGRRALFVSAVAGAVAASAVIAGGWVALRPPPEPAVPFEAVPVTVTVPGDRTGVEATAGLVPHTWGVEVRLTGSGFEDGDRYRVSVLSDDGRRYPAGEFIGTGEESMVCNLNSSVLREDATGFVVRDAGDRVVVRSRFDT